MAKPEEFIIKIGPDGRIMLDGKGLHAESYRRLIELLQETVGPVREIELAPEDPPTRHLHPLAGEDEEKHLGLDQKSGG